jgi:hypothetical protein
MEKRGRGVRAIGATLPHIAGAVLGRRGLGAGRLLADWAAIVGADLAELAQPDKLSFTPGERSQGTLRLRVAPTAAVEIQHRAPIIIERINGALGYAAVARLALVQAPLPNRRPRKPAPPRTLEPAERQALDRRLATVTDPELREALDRLGQAVIGTKGVRR